MEIIARVYTDFPEKFGIPRQSGLVDALEARVVFEPAYRSPEALRGLEGFSVVHQRLDGVGRLGACKFLLIGLAALDHRDRQNLLTEVCVYI